jgi:hypothetical protein
MLLADVGALAANTPLDFKCIQLAYRHIMAKKELDELFKPVMNEDRAFQLGTLVNFGDEEKALKYVNALTISKANKYGSASKNG